MRFLRFAVLSALLPATILAATSSAQETPAAPAQPVIITLEFYKSQLLQRTSVHDCGMHAGVQYTTTLSVTVDISGKLDNIRVIESAGTACLDEIALAAVKEASFAPATGADGKPTTSTITVPVKLPFRPARGIQNLANAPHLVYSPGTDIGRCKFHQHIQVTVSVIVKADGTPDNIKLYRSGGDECIDKRAVELASQYRFSPATKDDQPIAAALYLSMDF